MLSLDYCVVFVRECDTNFIPSSLSDLDIATMKKIGSMVNLIPVLSKADTLTTEEVELNKTLVQNDICRNSLLIYLFNSGAKVTLEGSSVSEPVPDHEELEYVQMLQRLVPFTVISRCKSSPSTNLLDATRETRWGTISIGDDAVCDMGVLRNCLFTSHLRELKESTVAQLYEAYREQQLTEHVPNGTLAVTCNGTASCGLIFGNGACPNSLA